jgi:hypothetical protein
MAFTSIPASAIEVGRAIKKSLFTTIKNNFDDHETRLNLVEAGVEGVQPIIFTVKGNYDLMTTAEKANVAKTSVSSDITITDVVLYIDEAGDAGTTEIDILTNTLSGPTYTTIFTTKPTVGFATGDDGTSVDQVLDGSNVNVDAGDIIKLAITGSQNLPNSFMVRIDYVFR